MGNGIRPLEKTLGGWGPSEQYIEHQKATIDLIQWGEWSRSLVDFAAGSTRSETWQGNISSFWTDDGVKRNVIRRSYNELSIVGILGEMVSFAP